MKTKPSFIQKYHSTLSALVGWVDIRSVRWPVTLAALLTIMVACAAVT